VGDSRAYLLQQGELSRLTEDHSLVEDLVREGQLSADEAAIHPQRHILTRVLGMGPDVEPDVWQILPYEGDRLLLCSDGLTNEVSDSEIASVLRRLADPADAARELVRLARAHGGSDNITVVVIDVVDDDDRSLVASRAVAEADGDAAGRAGGGSAGGGGRSRGRRVATPAPEEADGGGGHSVSTLAPPAEEEPGADLGIEDGSPHHRLTVRVVAFVVVLMIVLGGAAGAVGWYARNSWFVGLRANRVTIFQGRPTGLLWFHPSVRQTTVLTTDSVLPARLDDLRRGKEEPSLPAARRYVANLGQEAAAAGLAPPAPAGSPAAAPAGAAPTTTSPGARPAALLAGPGST
jgi:protein phosphatase